MKTIGPSQDRPGTQAALAERLAAAKINITCAYATAVIPGGCPVPRRVAVVDADKAEKAFGSRSLSP